jgi:hypothetical protein
MAKQYKDNKNNIHRLYLHRADSLAQLMQTVKANTKYDFIFWLFTINSSTCICLKVKIRYYRITLWKVNMIIGSLNRLLISHKYYILNKYIDSIYDHGLQGSVVVILEELIDNARVLENLKRNIKPLFRCEIQDANFLFGYRIGSKYYDLIESEHLEKQINDIVYYLRDNYDAIRHYSKSDNATFIDFFIHAYFEQLITNPRIGLEKLYTVLEKRNIICDKKIGFLIKRNLSCTAGNIYERSHLYKYKVEFCEEYKVEFYDLNRKDNFQWQ